METYSFGEWVSQRRKSLGITQRDLADRAACGVATIKKIESDERRPSRELAVLLADALYISSAERETFVECARGLRSVAALANLPAQNKQEERAGSAHHARNLPVQPTPLIGREAELAQIRGYLDDPACRLLTLTGSGGIGKTRLALAVGEVLEDAPTFQNGVCFVPLAGISAPDYLLGAIAERLKLSSFLNNDPKSQLLNFLQQKHLLLVMDNFEHLLDGVALLTDILATAPYVKILVTSRERLNLSSEWLFPVSGLPFSQDESLRDATSYAAVQLFESSARRTQPGYHIDDALPAVIDICRLVEGMPLAIELAATWTRRMPPAQIAVQIQRDLNFLTAGWRDVPERHRSIGALFAHSWQMLSREEQAVLMRLSIFRGGFDLEAAQQIVGASLTTLASLEDKSFIRSTPAGRYDLHELIRQYAESRLTDAGNVAEIHRLHLDYFMQFAETASHQLYTAEQVTAARRIKMENNNLRAALTWAFAGNDAEKGLRVANALWFYWFRWAGSWSEGLRWLELGLSQTEGVTAIRANSFAYAGNLAAQARNMRAAQEYMRRSLEYAQQLGLKSLIGSYILGMSYQMHDYAVVASQFEDAIALFREVDDRMRLATALFLYGGRARLQGDLARARSLYDASLEMASEDQNLMLMSWVQQGSGRLAALEGDYQRAQKLLRECAELARQMDNPSGMEDLNIFQGRLALYQGDYGAAEHYLTQALLLAAEYNNVGGRIHASYFLAELALHRRQFVDAIRLLVESVNLTLSDPEWRSNFTNHEFNSERLMIAGKLAYALGDAESAARLLGAGEAVRAQSGYLIDPLPRAEYESAVSQIRSKLGEAAFMAAWQAGQALSGEAALLLTIDILQWKLNQGRC